MNELGDYLKNLRGKMSLREAAKRTGISFSYIGYLESGKHPRTGAPIKPSPEMLKAISKGYNHSYKDLMMKAGYSYDEKGDDNIEETEADMKRRLGLEYIKKIKDEKTLDLAIELLEKLARE